MKRKTSEIWCFFRAVDDTYALCNICKAKLSYKTTTTNLSKHMNRMHPSANTTSSSTGSARDGKYKILSPSNDRHRAKARNPAQELILLNFIKKHPVLLQNPSWDTRSTFETLWDQLTSELNGNGPPQKDVNTWKKALKDWKRFIIKKVEKNEMHNIPLATGLNSAEETIASLCRLNEDASQELNASDDDLDNSNATFDMEDVEDVVPKEEDHSALQDASGYVYEPDDFKADIEIDPLIVQSGKRSSFGGRTIQKELEIMGKNISSVNDAASSTQLALNEFCALYKQKLMEDKRHHSVIEQLMAEKIELKKKLLEIEQRKLSLK